MRTDNRLDVRLVDAHASFDVDEKIFGLLFRVALISLDVEPNISLRL